MSYSLYVGVPYGGTRIFTATDALPGDRISWVVTGDGGWVTPTTGSVVTFTAPLTGTHAVVTWTSLDDPMLTASVYIFLGTSTVGYQFNNPTDNISLSPGTSVNNAAALTLVIPYILQPGTIAGLSSSSNYNIISQWGASVPDTAFALYTPAASGNLVLILNNATALAEVPLTSVMIDDGNPHILIVQFYEPNHYEFWIDDSLVVPTTGGSPIIHISNSTQPIVVGNLTSVGLPFPGIIIGGRLAIYGAFNFSGSSLPILGSGGTSPATVGSDIYNIYAGYPPDVIEWQFAPPNPSTNQTGPLAIFAFNGISPYTEPINGVVATISGATPVGGYNFFPPYLAVAAFNEGRTNIHIPGSGSVNINWANERLSAPYSANFTFTDSDPTYDIWSPETITLPANSGTVSSDLSVLVGQSAGSQNVTITNQSNFLPIVLDYTITGASLIKLANNYPQQDDSGCICWLEFVKVSDGSAVCLSGYDNTVTATLSITTSGVTRIIPVQYFAFGGVLGGGWFPTTRQWAGIVDDGGSGFSIISGTWSTYTPSPLSTLTSDGNTWNLAVYNGFMFSNTSGMEVQYQWTVSYYGAVTTSTGCFGNMYQLQGCFRYNFPGQVSGAATGGPYCPGNLYLSGGSPTQHAQASITGDGGSTFHNTAIDQTTTGATGTASNSDDNDQLRKWVNIGTPFAANQALITMNLTRTSGTDYLIADAYRLKFISLQVLSTDTLVFNSGDSAFSSSTGAFIDGSNIYHPGTFIDTTEEIINAPVTHLTFNQIAPFNSTKTRKLKIGHNPTYPQWTSPGITYANRLRTGWGNGATFWHPGSGTTSSNFTTDIYGQITRLDAHKSIYVLLNDYCYNFAGNQNNGVDTWDSMIIPPDGAFPNYSLTFLWDNEWTGTITLFDNVTNTQPTLGTPLSITTLSPGTTGVKYSWTYNQPTNASSIGMIITSEDGTFPTRLRIFDSLTPPTTTTEIHPVELSRWSGGGPIRPNDIFHTNNPSQANQNNYPPDGGATVEGPEYSNWNVNSYVITEFAPVDFSDSDNDGALAYWPTGTAGSPGASANNSSLKVTLETGSDVLYPGQNINFVVLNATDVANLHYYKSNGATGGPTGTPGIGFAITNGSPGLTNTPAYIYSSSAINSKLPLNTYLIFMGTNDTYTSTTFPPTAVATYTPVGSIGTGDPCTLDIINFGTPTFEATVRTSCVEAGVPIIFPIEIGEAFNNATLTWKTHTVLSNTEQGMKIYPELGNEPFGASGSEESGVLAQLIIRGILGTGGQEVNYTYGRTAGYAFHQIYEIILAWDTAHGTHRILDFCPTLNTNGASTNDQFQGLIDAGNSPILGQSSFSAISEFNQLVVMLNGYFGNDLDGNASIGSYIYGAMVNGSPSLVPIGTSMDCLPPPAFTRLFAYHFYLDLSYKQGYMEGLVESAIEFGFSGSTGACYECAIDSLKPYTAKYLNYGFADPRSVPYYTELATRHLEISLDKSMYQATLSFFQNYLEPVFTSVNFQPTYGSFACIYTTDGNNFINQGDGWQVYTSVMQQNGFGSATDLNPGHLATIKSQVGGAIQTYNGPVSTGFEFNSISQTSFTSSSINQPASNINVGSGSGTAFYPDQINSLVNIFALSDTITISTGLQVSLMLANDPLNSDPGTKVTFGITIGPVVSGTNTFDDKSETSPLAGSTETIQTITLNNNESMLLTDITVPIENMNSINPGDTIMVRISRRGTDVTDTNSRRVVLLGVDISGV